MALARGAWTGMRITRMPTLVATPSKSLPNLGALAVRGGVAQLLSDAGSPSWLIALARNRPIREAFVLASERIRLEAVCHESLHRCRRPAGAIPKSVKSHALRELA
jgi:hypothetical protein